MRRLIGGFFELHLPAVSEDSLFHHWHLSETKSLFFANARSALYHLLASLKPKRVWLPAYCCLSIAHACEQHTIQFYPIDENLQVDVKFLTDNIEADDAILAIDYFGRVQSPAFQQLVKNTPHCYWLQDKAQSLSNQSNWGDWQIYSPRKLIGVADGGILHSEHRKLPSIKLQANTTSDFIEPALLRLEDKMEQHNHTWYQRYVEHEEQLTVSDFAMSELSQYLLSSIAVSPLIRKRQENYLYLAKHLSAIAFLPDVNNTIPFAFVIKHALRDKLWQALSAKNIFAAKHWAQLPAACQHFTEAQLLSQQLLSLPCDQRYGEAEMAQIVAAVKEILW